MYYVNRKITVMFSQYNRKDSIRCEERKYWFFFFSKQYHEMLQQICTMYHIQIEIIHFVVCIKWYGTDYSDQQFLWLNICGYDILPVVFLLYLMHFLSHLHFHNIQSYCIISLHLPSITTANIIILYKHY